MEHVSCKAHCCGSQFSLFLVVTEPWRDFQGWLDSGLFSYLWARSEILKQEKLVRSRWEMLDPPLRSVSFPLVVVLLSLDLSPSLQVILCSKWLATICTCPMPSLSEGSMGVMATVATPLISVTVPLALEKSHVSPSTEQQQRMPSFTSHSGKTKNVFSWFFQNWLK